MRPAALPRSTIRAVAIFYMALAGACGSSKESALQGELCVRCHGDATRSNAIAGVDPNLRAAPPITVNGATATTDPKVGAHQAHLVAGRLRGPIACSECHVVPTDMPAHEAEIARIKAGTAQAVTFGGLAIKGGPATYDAASMRCSGTYCHGATLNRGGANHTPLWTGNASEAACASCHGYPPANTHVPAASFGNCSGCHSDTLDVDNFTIKVAADGSSKHMNGRLDVSGLICSGTCTTCHGAPTGITTLGGAHLAHVTTTATTYGVDSKTADTLTPAATTYDFGCGSCHSTNCDDHASGKVDLSPLGATAGSLKALNDPAAAYTPGATPGTGTCSGVYCHSSGQATAAYVTTPAWNSTAPLGCNGCHANPPSYASGGAGTATANSHVQLDPAGAYEWGHFAGFPGVTHDNSKHGGVLQPSTAYWYGQSSAPITCQTCHYDTASAANAGASGFYYLDTSGNYEISDTVVTYTYACGACHDGTKARAGTGKVMPYFHVNGARDVRFDPRTDLSGMDAAYAAANLPANPNTPTRPYWFTNGSPLISGIPSMPTDAVANGSTLSLDLQSAGWNATTKTCSSVACHFNQTSVQWGGQGGEGSTSCSACHTL